MTAAMNAEVKAAMNAEVKAAISAEVTAAVNVEVMESSVGWSAAQDPRVRMPMR